MVVIAPHSYILGTSSGRRWQQAPRTAWQAAMAESRDAQQRAEDDVLRSVGLLDATPPSSGSGSSGSRQPAAPQRARRAGRPARLWTRPNAALAAQAVMALVRYPQYSVTLYTQFTGGRRPPLTLGLWRAMWRHMPVGILYQGFSGYHLGVVGALVNALTPGEISSLWAMAASVAAHYLVFALLYGSFRQALVTRLLDVGGVPASFPRLVAPALWWARDRLLLRRPRGSVLCVYVRDVVGNLTQGALSIALSRVLTSPQSIAVYLSVARIGCATRQLAASALRSMGLPALIAQSPYALGDLAAPGGGARRALPPAHSTRRRALMRATAEAAAAAIGGAADGPVLDMQAPMARAASAVDSNDVEVVFTSVGDQLGVDDDDRPPPRRRRRPGGGGDADGPAVEKDEVLVYTQAVCTALSSIAARALLYPVDALIVRLMADQAGLTRLGYTGFFSCLARVCRSPTQGLSSLYAGFASALLSDLALGWATAEAVHYLCKSAGALL
ncbi:hypothetical protein GGF38_002038 [Coemansia sp. RSA 25]|nr:hypothetical protein GGF38_002038 [Coemansia sp. RSA 25]